MQKFEDLAPYQICDPELQPTILTFEVFKGTYCTSLKI